MMTECREARRHGDKLMRGKGMERYQLKLSSSSGCRHVLFVTRVIADIVSEHITEGEGSGSGAIEESLRRLYHWPSWLALLVTVGKVR